ncbi:MAG: hypothetical protein O2840_01070 [bacterium]|nr:hypothetical protein [bacterium]
MIKQQPIAPNRIIQVLVVIIVVLALLAGYYHALYQTEVRKQIEILKANPTVQQ